MPSSLFSPLVERAIRWAGRAHRSQTRKGTDLPYLVHPASVALILLRAGFDEERLLAAALLHDVVEDTDSSLQELRRSFPSGVVDLVAAVTERKRDASSRKRPWIERKTEHLDALDSAPTEVRALILADKLHNLGCMWSELESGETVWDRFNASRERILWYHRETIARALGDGAEARLRRLAADCRELLERIESSAGSVPG